MLLQKRIKMRKRTIVSKLRQAATYIKNHGWCQRLAEDDNGRVCLVGALSKVCNRNSSTYANIPDIRNVIKKLNPIVMKSRSLVDYNDTIGRTKEQVIELLETTAKKCEAK